MLLLAPWLLVPNLNKTITVWEQSLCYNMPYWGFPTTTATQKKSLAP